MTVTTSARTHLEPRMKNPVLVIPDAYAAVQALSAAAHAGGLPESTMDLVEIRASQINGCGLCLDMHTRMAKKHGETDQRLFSVGAWRDAPFYTDAERAALALTEAVTRLADRAEPVPDELWDEVTAHFDERAVAALLLQIASINVWNRLNVPTRQVAGSVPIPD